MQNAEAEAYAHHPCLRWLQVLVPSAALDAIPTVSGGLASAASAPASPAASPVPVPSPEAEASPSPSPAPVPSPSPSPAPVPSPSPAQSPSAPAPAPEPEQPAQPATGANSISGVALGTGHLAGCEVQLVRNGEALKTATTDGSGRFTLDCGADCASLGVSAALEAGAARAGCGMPARRAAGVPVVPAGSDGPAVLPLHPVCPPPPCALVRSSTGLPEAAR